MNKLEKILNIKYNEVKPETGKLLIAEPFLADAYFGRSVVLLAGHGEEGSFGLIINKPIQVQIHEIIKGMPKFGAKVFLGGPVYSTQVFYLHTVGEKLEGSSEIIPGLWWGGNADQLWAMIENEELANDSILFFLGYSGWAPKQLEGELKQNSWIVTSASTRFILKTPSSKLWASLLKNLDEDYAYWVNFPLNPQAN
ncbi:MAG TPA: YqgE/AlgH family protein [Bacteroidales bacterium]|nr:YqgE/AlgH family protein [Bacteroidales bacterium]